MPAAWQPPLAWIPGLATWLVIWIAMGVATVALAVLLRTRWREVRTWKKCALLSAWVHVLLALLAANVRIGVGGAGVGPGSGGPMRVAVVSVAPTIIADGAPITTLLAPEPEPASGAEEPPAPGDDEADTTPDELPPVDAAKPAVEETDAEAPRRPEPSSAEPKPTPIERAVETIVLDRPDDQLTLPTADLALEAPDLLPKPVTPEVEAEAKPDDVERVEAMTQVEETLVVEAALPEPSVADAAAAGAAPKELVSTTASTSIGPNGALVDPNAAPRPGVPAAYANRFADRDAMVAGGGGDPTTERAVRAALAWLAAAQEKDGHWDPKRHGAGQERYVFGENRGGAGAQADTGITALALLAFMGSGHTHREGPYADNIARGLDYLRRSQGANGNLGGRAELFAHMYCHSMATFAVSEACALTGDERLRPIIERAVLYSLAAQHPSDGGWRYRPGDTGDTSQLGWQLMALRSAELAGVAIPPAVWPRVEHFLKNVERGAAGGLAAYRPEGPPSRAMTAEALFCRQLLTHRASGGLSAAAFEEARRALLEEQPGGVVVNFYYWYYATIALHRAQHETPAATEAWEAWNASLTATLVGSQSADGSWSSACLWGGYGGRVYTTSLAAMCLEVYYRYAPDDAAAGANVAQRNGWEATPAR